METLQGHVTVTEAARRTGLTRGRVKYLVRKGTLSASKPGRDILIKEASLGTLLGAADVALVQQATLQDYLTVPEAARVTGLTPGYFVNLIHDGRLSADRVGRDWFIARPSFESLFGPNAQRRRAR